MSPACASQVGLSSAGTASRGDLPLNCLQSDKAGRGADSDLRQAWLVGTGLVLREGSGRTGVNASLFGNP